MHTTTSAPAPTTQATQLSVNQQQIALARAQGSHRRCPHCNLTHSEPARANGEYDGHEVCDLRAVIERVQQRLYGADRMMIEIDPGYAYQSPADRYCVDVAKKDLAAALLDLAEYIGWDCEPLGVVA